MNKHFLPKLALSLLIGGTLGAVFPVPSLHLAVLFALFLLLGWVAYVMKLLTHAVWIFILVAATVFGFFLSRQTLELEEGRYAQLFGPVEGLAVRVLSDPYLERQATVELIEPPYTNLRMVLGIDTLRSGNPPAFRQTIRISGVAHGRRLIPYYWEPYEGKIPALTPIEQFRFLCFAFRDRIDRAIQTARPPPAFLAFARAELFGKRADLDNRTLRILQDNGLTHIIAVSGMHTSLLAAVLFFLLAPAFGRESAVFFTCAAVGVFCVIVGMQPSVLRSSFATCLTLLGTLLGRPVRMFNILAATFIIEFLLFPEDLRNIGFQLSYLAILSLSICAFVLKPVNDTASGKVVAQPAWIKALLPLLLIQVFTSPLIIYLFYRWSILSLLSNLLFLPVFTFLIALAACGSLLALFWPAMAVWLFWIGDMCLQTMMRILGSLPAFFSISSNYGQIPFWFLIAFLGSWVLFLLLIPRTPKNWLLGSTGFLACLILFPVLRNATAPLCVAAGGELAPYTTIEQGSRILYAHISLPRNQTAYTLTPFIQKCLRDGIKRIDRLDAESTVKETLAQEFDVGTSVGVVPGMEFLQGGGFVFNRAGLELAYLNSASQPPARFSDKARSPLSWLVAEPAAGKMIRIPQNYKPGRVYILGSSTPEELRAMMSDMEEKEITDVLATSVDGQLELCLDNQNNWHYTTSLMELLKESFYEAHRSESEVGEVE